MLSTVVMEKSGCKYTDSHMMVERYKGNICIEKGSEKTKWNAEAVLNILAADIG